MKRLTHSLAGQTADAFNARKSVPEEIGFRLATLGDVDAIMEIGDTCFKSDGPERPKIQHFVTKAHAAILLLCDGDRPVGYVHVEAHAGRKNLYLNTTALLPDYRGKGLGNRFYEITQDLAHAVGASSVWCHVAMDNEEGLHLLKKNGYRIERTEDPYYDDGRAAYIMRKSFDA